MKAIIFDMDGVLIDSERVSLVSWLEAFASLKQDVSEAYILSFVGMSSKEIKDKITFDYSLPVSHDVYALMETIYYDKIKQNKIPLLKGVLDTLVYLKDNNIKCAVASSAARFEIETILTNQNVISYFDLILGFEDVSNTKPSPEIYLKALKLLEINKEDAYIVEDSNPGIMAGNAAGVKVIAIPDLSAMNAHSQNVAFIKLDSMVALHKMLLNNELV